MTAPLALPDRSKSADAMGTLARVLGGVLTIDDAAALLGESEATVRARFGDPAVAAAATREAVRMRLAGELIEARAQALMPEYLDRLELLLTDPDTSASVVVEVGRELGALSGSKTRAEGRAKREAGGSDIGEGQPLIVIHMGERTLEVGAIPAMANRVIEHGRVQ